MANKTLFSSMKGLFKRTDTTNEAGGDAYKFEPKHALAQIAATGCFHGVYYSDAQSQLALLLHLVEQVDDDAYIAKLAIYARERAFMKDMPTALLLILSKRNTELMHQIFDRVIDNGRVLRTLFQMIRSGQFGRTSLSSSLQRAFQRWLNEASVGRLLSASIGNDPSLRDVLRLARPTPIDNERRAFFGWLTDKEIEKWVPATVDDLPQDVRALNAYRQAEDEEAQVEILNNLSVRWDLLADAAKGPKVWKAIAQQMGPQALRMNLNTLLRHEVFITERGKQDRKMIDYVANRLSDKSELQRARQFPYQYLAAHRNADIEIPLKIRTALHQAAEIACGNVPKLPGPVIIGLDTSSSMGCAVTGYRGRGATSKMRCVDVAALYAAAILRRNPDSVIVPFDTRAYEVQLDPKASILSMSERLSQYGGGGTNCSIPLHEANTTYRQRKFVGCVLVSDSESWVGKGRYGSTATLTEWNQFVKNQKKLGSNDPKLVCINIQAYGSTQAPERDDILNIGGFSDAVFHVVSAYLDDDATRFVQEVESIIF